jgi:hypothetical protein
MGPVLTYPSSDANMCYSAQPPFRSGMRISWTESSFYRLLYFATRFNLRYARIQGPEYSLPDEGLEVEQLDTQSPRKGAVV